MNKRDIKKVILAQLSNTLRHDVIIDGIECNEGDLTRAWEVQNELADEFQKRSAGAKYIDGWGYDE